MRDARHAGKRHDQARGNERVSKAIEEFRSFASTLAAQNIEHVNLPIALYEERWLQLNEVQSAFECPHSQQLHHRSSLRGLFRSPQTHWRDGSFDNDGAAI